VYRPIDILAGLTFISPSFYNAILKIHVNEVDGAYWTLTTEFSFYIVFGFLYFRLGWKWAIAGLIALWLIATGLHHVTLPFLRRAPEPLWWIGCDYFGWFASGAIFYRAHENRSDGLFVLAIVIASASSLTNRLIVGPDIFMLLATTALFAASQRFVSVQRLLGTSVLFFVGTVSYPLYLLHNHLGIGLIAYLSGRLPIPSSYVPLLVFCPILAAAYAVHRMYEARASTWLKKRLL
jgi:peptidoglycan/LPS O-acetylase OafA/YrhL